MGFTGSLLMPLSLQLDSDLSELQERNTNTNTVILGKNTTPVILSNSNIYNHTDTHCSFRVLTAVQITYLISNSPAY